MSVEINNSVGAPESLDQRFFEEVLENVFFETGIPIKQVTFEMGSAGGDNYCSQIYRVRISFQRPNEEVKSVSVIVKSVQVTEGTQFLTDLKVFLKETVFYNHMLPRMEILSNNQKFGGRLYYSAKEPTNTLVFEDLCATGFTMANRQTGLDFSHCEVVMKKIGCFHGISMVLLKKDPDCMKPFGVGMIADEMLSTEAIESLFKLGLDALIKLSSSWEGYESIVEKLKKYGSNLKQNILATQEPIPGELKVLNHGDLWVNNMLFKYDGDKVEDLALLDFQLSKYGSPGLDLNYFFYSSLQFDVLKNKREELLRIYHNSLSETLMVHKLKNIPSLDDIIREVRRREPFGFFVSYGILPTVSMDKNQSSDNTLEKFADKEYADKKSDIMFSSKRLQETMRYNLKQFDAMGVLD